MQPHLVSAAIPLEMEVAPYHSVRGGEMYYHNNNECTSGNLIPLHDLTPGRGEGKLLCATQPQPERI